MAQPAEKHHTDSRLESLNEALSSGGFLQIRRMLNGLPPADAAHLILCKPAREFSGHFCIDDQVLYDAGVRDFSGYAAVPGTPESELLPDLFLPEDLAPLPS